MNWKYKFNLSIGAGLICAAISCTIFFVTFGSDGPDKDGANAFMIANVAGAVFAFCLAHDAVPKD